MNEPHQPFSRNVGGISTCFFRRFRHRRTRDHRAIDTVCKATGGRKNSTRRQRRARKPCGALGGVPFVRANLVAGDFETRDLLVVIWSKFSITFGSPSTARFRVFCIAAAGRGCWAWRAATCVSFSRSSSCREQRIVAMARPRRPCRKSPFFYSRKKDHVGCGHHAT